MKRRRIVCLLMALTLLLAWTACFVTASAASTDGWRVYTLGKNEQGTVVYKDSAEYKYQNGLRATPTAGDHISIQTMDKYKVSEGFFIEVCVENMEVFSSENYIMFHIWDKPGKVGIGAYEGTGWYGMIMPRGDESHYMMGAAVSEKAPNDHLQTTDTVTVKRTASNAFRYTFEMIDGVMYVNGNPLRQSGAVTEVLRQFEPGMEFYIGCTVITTGKSISPVTVTRFGLNKAGAVAPVAGAPSNPGNPGGDQDPSAPSNPSNPSQGGSSDTPSDPSDPAPETNPGGNSSPNDPSQGGTPAETNPNNPGGDAPIVGIDPDDTEWDPSEYETRIDENGNVVLMPRPDDTSVDVGGGILGGLYNLFDFVDGGQGCGSAIGAGGVVCLLSVSLGAAWLLRKKRQETDHAL